jgi:RNA polymerase sigma-70 factor (ECF subfamily)
MGDTEAFKLVFERLAPGLRAFALRHVDSEEQAEDVIQDLFLALWRQRETLDLRVSLVTYLYTATRNRALSHLRHERVVRRWERTRQHLAARVQSPVEEGVLEAELARAVEEAMARLPERTRLVFAMSRQQRMTYGQIADALGVSLKTVETQMGRALRLMRVQLREFFT